MEFYCTDDGKLGLREVPQVLVEMLRQIPLCSNTDVEEVESRLFPVPTMDEDEERLRDDWKAYVQPELHELFQSSRQVVEADLRGLKEEGEFFSVEFPVKHADAWLNALNQARLALAAQHNVGEEDAGRDGPRYITNERDLALFQIDFYAGLQQWLVEIVDQ